MGRQKFDYDLVIIGGGSAGIVAGNVAGAVGARVALVEKSRIGGECLWTGCVPSKALLHVADAAHTMRTGKALGLQNVRLSRDDCAGAFDYVREKIQEVKNNDATEQMLRDFGVALFFGEGRFASPHLFTTPQGDLRGAQFLLATGSSPKVPDLPGLADTGYLTNQTLFDLDHIPESLLILGGGYIACEMGQALNRLGCLVTIIERGERLLKKDDRELTGILTDVLRHEGVGVVLNAEAVQVRRNDAGHKVVTIRTGGDMETDLVAEEILVTVGRTANTRGLNLTQVGVTLDDKGNVAADATGRTNASHIWACGDIAGKYQFSHMAEQEAKAIVRNILFPGTSPLPYDLVPWATFTDPELATVGLTEEDAREKYGEQVQVLRHDFRQDDRAIVENRTVGQVKVIVAGLNGNVVGAQILGPRAGELIQEWVIAMQHKMPVRAIADLVHVYPALSVSNQRAAQRWYAGVMKKPVVQGALALLGFNPKEAGNL